MLTTFRIRLGSGVTFIWAQYHFHEFYQVQMVIAPIFSLISSVTLLLVPHYC